MLKKNDKVPNRGDHRLCMSSFILALLTGAKTKLVILKQFLHQAHLF